MAPAASQTITLDTLSLRALPGVWVVVEPLPDFAAEDGLVTDSLRRLVETAVSDGGIRLLTEDEWQMTLGNPMLVVSLNLLHPSPYFYLYNIEVELRQLSTLPRDSTPVFGATWKAGDVLGTLPAERLPTLRFDVVRMVDGFIRAYATAQRYRTP